jgi:MFS family permease
MEKALLIKGVSVDGIITRLGFGRYQLRLFALLGLIMLADGLDAILTPILAQLLQTRWDLSDQQAAMLGGVRYLGMIFSSLFLGGLGDWAGRRKTLRYSLVLLTLAAGASIFMPEFWSFMVVRSLVGLLLGCCKPVVSCLSVELSPIPVRAAATIGLFVFYNLGSLGAVGLAFALTPDFDPEYYRELLACQTVVILGATVSALVWLEESPSFLWVKNQPEAAVIVLNRIAIMNQEPIMTVEEAEALASVAARSSNRRPSLSRLVDNSYLGRVVTGSLLWWVGSYTFYGFLFILPRRNVLQDSSRSEMLNMAIDVSMLLPGVFVSMPMVETRWLGQVRTMLLFSVGMMISSVACVWVTQPWSAIMSSAFIFSSNVFGLVLYPYTSELFDASLRNTGFSFCSFWSRVGGVISPLILVAVSDDWAYYSFAAHGLAACLLLMIVRVGIPSEQTQSSESSNRQH